MVQRHTAFLCAIGLACWAETSRAAIEGSVVEVAINPAAVTGPGGDPALAAFRTFDLRMTYPPGDSFNVAGMYADLSSGQFYSPPLGGTFPAPPSLVAMYPSLEYDTHLNFPGYESGVPSAVPGRLYGTGAAIMPTATTQQNLINIAWGKHGGPRPDGTFTIARLTISADAAGAMQCVVIGTAQPNLQYWFSADFTTGEMINLRSGVPEPGSFALVAFGMLAASARRRMRGGR